MFLNENELRREIRLTRRLLVFFDREIEKELSDERLTGVVLENPTAGTLRQNLLSLSYERRQLLYQLTGRAAISRLIEEKH